MPTDRDGQSLDGAGEERVLDMEDASVKLGKEDQKAAGEGNSLDFLGAMLSNPELMQRMKGVLGAFSSASAPMPQKDERGTAADDETPLSGSSDGLSALLSNPEIIARLPQMIAVLKPLFETGGGAPSAPPKHHSAAGDREHLFLALKPFLSKERCEAIDTILRISKLGEVLGHLR